MNPEDQLREYRRTLDAATEEAATRARTEHTVAPIRVRPARTLIIAAVAVAAAVGVAFAVVGTTDKHSSPPAGVTTTKPAPSTSSAPTTSETTVPHAVGSPLTLPVTVCPTQQGVLPSPSDPRAPASITIATPPFTDPALAGYSGTRGLLLVTAPAGWQCRALEATDGGQAVGVTPPGSAPRDSWGNPGSVTQPLTDGVFAMSVPACQGCVRGEICGIVPTATADFPDFASLPCTRPTGETVTARGNDVYEFDDPAGAIGPDAARSILRYVRKTAQTDATVVRETCILPASEHGVCDALFAEFLALQPTPWNQTPLSISPTALGAVHVGMNLLEAESSAGQTFDGQGDGFAYSRAHDRTGLHLYVGIVSAMNGVTCVGAELIVSPARTVAQQVVTPEGFALGGTVQQLLAIYGKRAVFVPAPSSGMTTNGGYVVKENGGALAFVANRGRITEIAGGDADSITPNSCTG